MDIWTGKNLPCRQEPDFDDDRTIAAAIQPEAAIHSGADRGSECQ
jgi:hypothetical protein